jgi:hypothetical protein
MARSPLTDTITRVQGMVTYVRQNLSEDEYSLFLDLVAPETVAPPKPTRKRKASKKAAHTSGNSRRGLPREEPLSNERRKELQRCVYKFDINGGKECGSDEESGIHDPALGYSGYHEYVRPFVAPTTAPRARSQSSRNGEALPAGVSSEINTEGATTASGG